MIIFRRSFIGLSVIAVLLAIWSVGIEPGMVKYRDYTIYVKEWPDEMSGFTIALLSDIHAGSPHITTEKLKEIVENTNARKPDIVLLAGDYIIQGVIGGTPISSSEIAETLSGLHAPHGVYGVLGNHDQWGNAAQIRADFEKNNIPMLEDASRKVTVGGSGFWLTGISDRYTTPHDFKKALSMVMDDSPVIAFTHSPDIFPKLPDRISLTLAGHTHGGQVYIPFIGRPIVPSIYGQRYAIGLIREGEKQLFVTPGIGTSIIPVRFLTPPEVSFLHIYPEKIN